jgi:NAD(P)-dependent dehydrogenase (short-subunit alcohol dehydrogenase family)
MRAVARPIPLPAPVTTITRFVSSFTGASLYAHSFGGNPDERIAKRARGDESDMTTPWTYTDGDYPLPMPTDARAMHSVEGKVIVVTGAGRGIGRGMALHLAKGGASVVVAEWKDELLASTLAEIEALGGQCLGVVTNIMEHDQIDAMVAAAVERFGRIDGLINHAQTFRPLADLATVSDDDLDVFYRSGVKGSLWAMQAVYPHMAGQQWGRIVNFASSMGITGGAGFAAYNASKEAIRALTRTAAREWAMDGIVVNAIAPAAATHKGASATKSEGYKQFIENCPMKRQGDPEWDLGPLAWFLCSDACRFVTGHTFMADGGAFMWA